MRTYQVVMRHPSRSHRKPSVHSGLSKPETRKQLCEVRNYADNGILASWTLYREDEDSEGKEILIRMMSSVDYESAGLTVQFSTIDEDQVEA